MLKLADIEVLDYNFLCCGASGTGKTSLLYLMICVIMRERLEHQQSSDLSTTEPVIFVADNKGASLYSLRQSFNNPEETLALLEKFLGIMKERSKLFDNPNLPLDSDYRTLGLPKIYFIFDEFVDCIEMARIYDKKLASDIMSMLVRCITTIRQLGGVLILTMMRADTNYLSGLVRSTMTKILLADQGKEPDADGFRMVFGTSEIPKPPFGSRFYGYIQGETGTPKFFLTPQLSEDTDIREVVKKYDSQINEKQSAVENLSNDSLDKFGDGAT